MYPSAILLKLFSGLFLLQAVLIGTWFAIPLNDSHSHHAKSETDKKITEITDHEAWQIRPWMEEHRNWLNIDETSWDERLDLVADHSEINLITPAAGQWIALIRFE